MNGDMAIKLSDLVNPEIELEYGGTVYHVRKATLRQVTAFQKRATEISKEGGGDPALVAYCIFLILKDKIPDLTEDNVMDEVPGDIDVMQIMVDLGFTSPEKLEMVKRLQMKTIQNPTTDSYLPSLLPKQDGPPNKLET